MIDPKRLLDDLKRLLKHLEDDLRERTASVPETADRLQQEYRAAREAGRTGEAFEAWREEALTQAAVAWILACVFVRFMEDNGLVDEPLISGPGERRGRAGDRQTLYFQAHPTDTDRDYLYDVFRTAARLPAVAKLYDEAHNPVWSYGISGDAARDLIAFWRKRVPETGELIHDFTDPDWNTRFLGDLYQDLSEAARKRYALLQTPEFVEEFILDRTLNPAIEEFGLKAVRLIDPTCGSGHFLLGAFRRLLDQWFEKEPGTTERELVQRALDGVYGVDVNPYAVAIARFRLLVEALKASGIERLKEAPGYRINVTAGDSLLHGRRFGELDLGSGAEQLKGVPGIGHAFLAEDLDELNRILGQQYHAVVGNPPYITVKDKALNRLYRERYGTCHRQYSLAVPFTERFFGLAEDGVGYVGMITANSFMKREFGKKLVEEFLPKVNLTHVIDTSGAYIPGHGTPTVILFGWDRRPVADTVRTVMGIKGEPATPEDAAKGLVWSAIVDQVDRAGSESEWVSVTDTPRAGFARHPWSIGGGGAAGLKESIDEAGETNLGDQAIAIGFVCITKQDDVFTQLLRVFNYLNVEPQFLKPFGIGEETRDWSQTQGDWVVFPYDDVVKTAKPGDLPEALRFMWPYRSNLEDRKVFGGQTYREAGKPWYEYGQIPIDRFSIPLSIVFADIATHNHFVLDRGGKVFNRTAPVIKLPKDATEGDHLALLGLLNSSTACFWLKQVCFPKGGDHVGTEGARVRRTLWDERYAHDGTKVGKFPVTDEKPLSLATALDRLARERQAHLPEQLMSLTQGTPSPPGKPQNQTFASLAPLRETLTRATLDTHLAEADRLLRRMIALQEELDWRCYELYGIVDPESGFTLPPAVYPPPPLSLGQRAFEIVMARQMARGELSTTWFERHRSKPITDIPADWPEDYRQLVERRIALIEQDRYVGLIERPEYKRRWNQETWEDQEKRALRGWLLDRLEIDRYWPEPRLRTTRTLADRAQTDADFVQVAELYVGHAGFDIHALIAELAAGESVPFLPVLRYKDSGLRKREVWEKTWDRQRQEDLTQGAPSPPSEDRKKTFASLAPLREASPIPPPPKYRSTDFLNATFWRLRGALDVPKERFVSYPHCSRDNDPSLLLGWAGWNHLQQAQALAGYYTEVAEQEGWTAERLKPLLAGLAELLPWLRQWHNDVDPEYNERMGDFFETFLRSELRKYGLTPEDLRAWTPPVTGGRRRRRRA